jgi:hypothetical protein
MNVCPRLFAVPAWKKCPSGHKMDRDRKKAHVSIKKEEREERSTLFSLKILLFSVPVPIWFNHIILQ